MHQNKISYLDKIMLGLLEKLTRNDKEYFLILNNKFIILKNMMKNYYMTNK